MIINFYSGFEKKENSTKLPSGSASLSLTGTLKEKCSIEMPVIKIERLASDAVPSIYNYAYIPAFNRYYYVNDWIWSEGVWECQMSEDYLGSWKTDIGNTFAYIERCAATFNGDIPDKLYPTTTEFDIEEVELDSMYYRVAPSGGCFVLGIINNWNFSTPQAGGAVTYYALSVAEMRNLMQYLMSDTFLDDCGFPATATAGQQLLQTTAKAFINPIQYITSCIWYPLDVEDIAQSTASDIVLGFWENEIAQNHIDGHKVEAFVFTSVVEETIPSHPQYSRGNYLNFAPYTRVTLHIPPFGTIPIDTSFLALGDYMKANIYVDVITGKAQMRVTIQESALVEDNQAIVAESTAMFGIPIQLAQMLPDYLGGLTNTVSAASAAVSGITSSSFVGGALNALLSLTSIGNAADSIMPQLITEGVSGSFIQNVMPPSMTVEHIQLAPENLSEVGRPLCAIRQISALSGFIKCGEVSVDYPCLLPEKQKIKSFLMDGFFWE